MRKFVTLLIADSSDMWEIKSKKHGLVGTIEMEVIPDHDESKTNLEKRKLKGDLGWLTWAEYQISQWGKNEI